MSTKEHRELFQCLEDLRNDFFNCFGEPPDTDDPVTEAGKNKDRYKLSDGIEVMDLICKAGIGVAEGFCRGNFIKYIMRAPNSRTPAEDYAKAEHYARMLKNLEKRSTWRSEEEDNAG